MLFQGMKELKEFCIPFSSLKLGPNFFDFEIDKSFFDIFNYSRYNSCNISLNLEFRKENLLMDLRFSYSGYCEVFCDRCLDLVKVSISNNFNCGYGKGYSVLEVINTANEIYNNKIKFE